MATQKKKSEYVKLQAIRFLDRQKVKVKNSDDSDRIVTMHKDTYKRAIEHPESFEREFEVLDDSALDEKEKEYVKNKSREIKLKNMSEKQKARFLHEEQKAELEALRDEIKAMKSDK